MKKGTVVKKLEEILCECRNKSAKSAYRNKPFQWSYWITMARELDRWFRNEETGEPMKDDGAIAGAALALHQKAIKDCPMMNHEEAARWWALGVYARRLLQVWIPNGKIDNQVGRPSLDWLKHRDREAWDTAYVHKV